MILFYYTLSYVYYALAVFFWRRYSTHTLKSARVHNAIIRRVGLSIIVSQFYCSTVPPNKRTFLLRGKRYTHNGKTKEKYNYEESKRPTPHRRDAGLPCESAVPAEMPIILLIFTCIIIYCIIPIISKCAYIYIYTLKLDRKKFVFVTAYGPVMIACRLQNDGWVMAKGGGGSVCSTCNYVMLYLLPTTTVYCTTASPRSQMHCALLARAVFVRVQFSVQNTHTHTHIHTHTHTHIHTHTHTHTYTHTI